MVIPSAADFAKQMLEAVERSCNQELSGPAEHPPELTSDQPHPPAASWLNGWWLHAKQSPAHPGRVGGPIRPWSVVFHTTDMLPASFDALAEAWATKGGPGNENRNAAHFVIGRDESHGVVQFVPINRNANHAGGPQHGVYADSAGATYHPNIVSVGIEVHNAGGLRLVAGEWRWGEYVSGKGWLPFGPAFDPADVEVDPLHPLRGWHRWTAYQEAQMGLLLDDLESVLAPMPAGARARSAPENAPAWADTKSARVVGHVDLDALNRSDPWPPRLKWLRDRVPL